MSTKDAALKARRLNLQTTTTTTLARLRFWRRISFALLNRPTIRDGEYQWIPTWQPDMSRTFGSVAIPHARLEGISEPVVVLGISEPGISFDAPDGQPAHVVILLVTPKSDPAVQLELSADIAHLFREPRCLERILRASNYTEVVAALKFGAVR